MLQFCNKFFNKCLNNPQRYQSFNLAEVLITFGIIGIVAALTIPALNNLTQDKEYKTAYKKAYSDLVNAYNLALANYEILAVADNKDIQNTENFKNIMSNMQIQKICQPGTYQNCWNINGEDAFDSSLSPLNHMGYIDNSGRSWVLRGAASTSMSKVILLDTNGLKGPNVYGKDRFPFSIGPKNVSSSSFATVSFGGAIFNSPYNWEKVIIFPDYTTVAPSSYTICHTPPCLFSSWLE